MTQRLTNLAQGQLYLCSPEMSTWNRKECVALVTDRWHRNSDCEGVLRGVRRVVASACRARSRDLTVAFGIPRNLPATHLRERCRRSGGRSEPCERRSLREKDPNVGRCVVFGARRDVHDSHLKRRRWKGVQRIVH
jgi:hypothetical protein